MKNIVFSLYMIGSLCFFVGTALAWWTEAAAGRDAGQWEGASDSEWYASLIQPDSGSSCCGEGDAWFADDTEVGPNGETIAIITDTRDDEPRKRRHIPPGTTFIIPPEKVRKSPSANPTGHNVIFIGTDNNVLCWEPTAKG